MQKFNILDNMTKFFFNNRFSFFIAAFQVKKCYIGFCLNLWSQNKSGLTLLLLLRVKLKTRAC
jgi:hypothetical protein